MPDRRFRLVDVFGETHLSGNPLAVVADSDGLSSEEMLEITRWLNFSETTFLLPPNDPAADYRVRIFTLGGELPFAGHPTLGTCHVWMSLGGESSQEVVQECGAGLVRVRRIEDRLAFEAPELIRSGPIDELHLSNVISVLGIERGEVLASNWVDNGPGWAAVLLADATRVLELRPDFGRSRSGEKLDIGVVALRPTGSETRCEVRAFFSDHRGGMVEDPVTGSLNASLAQWLLAEGRVEPPYVASQGTALGRSGRVYLSEGDGRVWVGGETVDIVDGLLDRFLD
ncbi:MAG: PhzF family phenazine biosynthesis protein [Acidimicrobiia bacterium]